MKYRLKFGAMVLLTVMLIATWASAHYHALTPAGYDQWQARKNAAVNYNLIWGHGYEHIWFDVAPVKSLVAHPPEGGAKDLVDALAPMKVRAVDGKEYDAYKFVYKPAERGDHILALTAGLQWDEEDGAWLQDYAKAVLHVQSEGGWDRAVGQPLEVLPLSRPYGIVPGAALSFRVLYKGAPAKGLRIERELLMPETPKPEALPAEPFIAYSAKTGPEGAAVFSFPAAGWYGVTAMRPSGEKREEGGHSGELVERSTLWVYVSEAAR